MSEWIKCTERLPENEEYVISYSKSASIGLHFNWYSTRAQRWTYHTNNPVTHWMPCPKKPEIEPEKE